MPATSALFGEPAGEHRLDTTGCLRPSLVSSVEGGIRVPHRRIFKTEPQNPQTFGVLTTQANDPR